jgi:hypothetical protein
MANRYAVANGNWSNTATWDGGTLPTTGDFVAANNFTVTIDQDINVGRLTTAAQSPAVAGGGFTVSTTRTVTLTDTSAIIAGTTNCITYSGAAGTVFTLNCGATGQFVRSTTSAVACVVVSSDGTMNATGLIAQTTSGVASNGISITGANSIVTFTGNIIKSTGNSSRGISTSVACTLTVIGDVESGSGNDGYGIVFGATGTLNITGNLTLSTNIANRCAAVYLGGGAVTTTCTITGNITGTSTNSGNSNTTVVVAGTNCSLYVTGNVNGGSGTGTTGPWAIYVGNLAAGSTNSGYINVVGAVTAGYNGPAIQTTTTTSPTLLSGPFICGIYGTFPLSVNRMHYIPTATSYFEFRNSSTNGALPPGAIAPTASMYDPSKIVDAPTANNVRSGISYALGSQTGTLVVPSSSSVAAGVIFDNGTTGSAILTADAVTTAVWGALAANLTGSNTIGLRVANCSTVSTTGDQIASLT